MQQSENARKHLAQAEQHVPKSELTDLERTINCLLDIGEGKEDLHRFMDEFFLAYLLDSLNYDVERTAMAERFYCYSYLQAIIRQAKDTTGIIPSTSKSLAV